MTSMTYAKPLPKISRTSLPHWEAAKRHELRFQRCRACGSWIYPIAPLCQNCWSEDYEWTRVSGRGKVSSWVVYHRAVHPGFAADVPYTVIHVDLDEGMRLVSNFIEPPPRPIEAGMPVEVAFEDVTPEISLVKFRATDQPA